MDRTFFTTFGVGGWMQIAGTDTSTTTTATTTTTSQCCLRPIASGTIAGFLHTH